MGSFPDEEVKKYTYSSMLDDFIRFEYKENFFDKTLNGVYVWAYLRFFVYNIVKDRKVAKSIQHSSSVVAGVEKLSPSMMVEKHISRNILFAHKKDALIVSHGRKVKDEKGFFRDWNTGYINERIEASHYMLDRSNTNEYYYPCRMNNVLEYHLYQFGKIKRILPQKNVVNKYDLYNSFLKPIEDHYGFDFSVREKNEIMGFADARVRDNDLLRTYVKFVLNRIKPRIIILGMVTDSIMQVFCEMGHEMGIPTVYVQEGVMFEALYCYYYKPRTGQNRFFADYLFCYGDYEKEALKFLPIDSDHVIPVGFPELEEYEKEELPGDPNLKRIMVISSATNYLAEIAGQLSNLLDSSKYRVIYKLHPREMHNYDKEIYPVISKYEKLEILDAPSDSVSNQSKTGESFKKAYTYFDNMTWIVGTASAALFEATKFKKKIAIVDSGEGIQSPLIEKKSAIRVGSAEELAGIIVNDSFVPNFSFRFYCDNAIDNMNREIQRIMGGT